MLPSLYALKKTLMYPRKLYMRRRENLQPGFLRSALELHYYRPAFYTWLRAISENRDLLHSAELDEHSLVLDVGAYTGDWAQAMIDRYNPTILAFEPDPRNLRHLLHRAQDIRKLQVQPYGLGGETETVRMAMQHLGSTVHTGHLDKSKQEWAEVEIRDIHSTWQSLDLSAVDLMKINIEGAEFPLLERMIETGLLPNVRCFLIQFHEWHPRAYQRRRRIRKALAETHRLTWDYHFIWEKWERKTG